MADTHCVSDIHGDQIEVDGRWYHANRIFGRPASAYSVGELVSQLAKLADEVRRPAAAPQCDEFVSPGLYRGCSSNETDLRKVESFAQVMVDSGGWGAFPMVCGRVEVVDLGDLERCRELVSDGRADVWTNELGWSRTISSADVGVRYVHVENGHHRMAGAALAQTVLGEIAVPVYDLNREERSAQDTLSVVDGTPGGAAVSADGRFRYCLVNRPAGIGCVPRMAFEVEPRPQPGAAHHDWARHGVLVVERPLTVQELQSFELVPVVDSPAALRWLAERVVDDGLGEYASAYVQAHVDDPQEFRAVVKAAVSRLDAGVRYSLGDEQALERGVLEQLQRVVQEQQALQEAAVAADAGGRAVRPREAG